MRCHGWGCVVATSLLFHGGALRAQNSLDALEQELKDVTQQQQDATSQKLSNFYAQLAPAMDDPQAAAALYQQAGGSLPDPSPVVTLHDSETESEKDGRLALDQKNLATIGTVLQLQCGLMNYAALFVVNAQQKGLQDAWVAWLQKAAPLYSQLAAPPPPPPPPPKEKPDPSEPKKRQRNDDEPKTLQRPRPFDPTDLKGKAMKDTLISKFLGFNAWGDKEQGEWAVQELPKLYRTNVLEPLRATPTAATLAAWNVYIAMMNSDESDDVKWNQEIYPPLQFERACDDYLVEPSTEKLEGLVNLIKANPTHPQAADWIARVSQLMDAYRARHGGAPTAVATTPAAASPAPAHANVTVTTSTQGDMTIVTTHTNAAPGVPARPVP